MSSVPVVEKKKKILVFDFDCTLTVKHMYSVLRTKRTIPCPEQEFFVDIFGGIDRVRHLQWNLLELKNYCDLAIVSFGYKEEIEYALQTLLLKDIFSEIYGRMEINTTIPKHITVNKLFNKNYDVKNDLLFIDDDKRNIDGANMPVYLANISGGLTISDMHNIKQWARNGIF